MTESAAWFFYRIASSINPIERKGAFDMRTMYRWEGVKPLKNEPMVYRIYLLYAPDEPIFLDQANWQAFELAWKKLMETDR
jgi:hypothetical protein